MPPCGGRLLGGAFVLATASAWIAASFLAQHLVRPDASGGQPSLHPLLLVWICTSLFSLYLPLLTAKAWACGGASRCAGPAVHCTRIQGRMHCANMLKATLLSQAAAGGARAWGRQQRAAASQPHSAPERGHGEAQQRMAAAALTQSCFFSSSSQLLLLLLHIRCCLLRSSGLRHNAPSPLRSRSPR